MSPKISHKTNMAQKISAPLENFQYFAQKRSKIFIDTMTTMLIMRISLETLSLVSKTKFSQNFNYFAFKRSKTNNDTSTNMFYLKKSLVTLSIVWKTKFSQICIFRQKKTMSYFVSSNKRSFFYPVSRELS